MATANALMTTEELLALRTRLFAAFPGPGDGPSHCDSRILRRTIMRRTFVKNHRNV